MDLKVLFERIEDLLCDRFECVMMLHLNEIWKAKVLCFKMFSLAVINDSSTTLTINTILTIQQAIGLKAKYVRGKELEKGRLGDVMKKDEYQANFIEKFLVDLSSPAQRNIIINAFRGHCLTLMRISWAAEVLETAYNDYANALQRSNIVCEFYGNEFLLFKVIIIAVFCFFLGYIHS